MNGAGNQANIEQYGFKSTINSESIIVGDDNNLKILQFGGFGANSNLQVSVVGNQNEVNADLSTRIGTVSDAGIDNSGLRNHVDLNQSSSDT